MNWEAGTSASAVFPCVKDVVVRGNPMQRDAIIIHDRLRTCDSDPDPISSYVQIERVGLGLVRQFADGHAAGSERRFVSARHVDARDVGESKVT